MEKRTAITYIDSNGDWHRCSKGAPEQIIDLCELKGETKRRAHEVIDKFAERGLRSLGVARQVRLFNLLIEILFQASDRIRVMIF